MKILLTGGGTGGHIVPLLAVVSELKELAAARKIGKPEFMLISPDSDFNKSISDAGIKVKTIKAGKLRRYFSVENLADVFRIPVGIAQSLYRICRFKPDVVFSKGGFASVPPVVAARILKIPILTHESDIVPGLANKMISFFATEMLVSFEDTQKRFPCKKVVLTGNPVRKDIFKGDKKRAIAFFGFKENIPTVLIFGGSQGAQKLNEIILKSLPDILEKCQAIHICGIKNYEKMKNALGEKKLGPETSGLSSFLPRLANERYKIYPYLDKEMKDAYALADVVVARAGANSLAEIIALSKLSIIIPLSTSANNHQLQNAEFFAKKGILNLIKEENLTSSKLTSEIFAMLESGAGDKIRKSIERYNNSIKQNPARLIAEEILKFG